MNCVRPVLQRKPRRGFAWACAPCNLVQEMNLEARNTTSLSRESRHEQSEPDQEHEHEHEQSQEHEKDVKLNPDAGESHENDQSKPSQPAATTAAAADAPLSTANTDPPTGSTATQAKLWPWRYFGVHSDPEDILDSDDRIYPRAKLRVGSRHQAVVPPWYGRPVEYVKKKTNRSSHTAGGGSGSSGNLPNDRSARPKWQMDEPPGYIPRGMDEPVTVDGKEINTSQLLWKPPTPSDSIASMSFVTDDQGSATVSGTLAATDADREKFIDDYVSRLGSIAASKDIEAYSTNFLDHALNLLFTENFNVEPALARVKQLDKHRDLKEPYLRPEQVKAFEAGVSKYGSELRLIRKHVGAVPHKTIVRYYYMWKKTPRGKQVWGNYEGRKSKQSRKLEAGGPSTNTPVTHAGKTATSPVPDTRLVDNVADDVDDSAFDMDKAAQLKKGFMCKFCCARSSRQWRRAPWTLPGTTVPATPEGGNGRPTTQQQHQGGNRRSMGANSKHQQQQDATKELVVSLCQRCAIVWRKYALQWEDIDDLGRRITAGGKRSGAGRRRIEEEMLVQLLAATECDVSVNSATATVITGLGITCVPTSDAANGRTAVDDTATGAANMSATAVSGKKRARDKNKRTSESAANGEPATKKRSVDRKHAKQQQQQQPAPPDTSNEPEPPRVRTLPCAVCDKIEPMGSQYLSCRDCRMSVHRSCYGIPANASTTSGNKWLCDTCSNDQSPTFSTSYACVLCPVTHTEQALMEPPRISHKKKTDHERERERLEKEMVLEAVKLYQQRQLAAGKPDIPREPLKRTESNNWAHVECAVWTPQVRFAVAHRLEAVEGIGMIPADRYLEECKICRGSGGDAGACVPCYHSGCTAKFHVSCARQNGYTLGFDIVTPAKQGRVVSATGGPAAASAPSSSTARDLADIASAPVVKIGEQIGVLIPVIKCSHHAITPGLHEMSEVVTGRASVVDWRNENHENGGGKGKNRHVSMTRATAPLTSTSSSRPSSARKTGAGSSLDNGDAEADYPVLTMLQFYVRTYKQADLTLTGTARKAMSVQQLVNDVASNRGNGHASSARRAPSETVKPGAADLKVDQEERIGCSTCEARVSPKWYPVLPAGNESEVNGLGRVVGPGKMQCHRCHVIATQALAQAQAQTRTEPPFQPTLAAYQTPNQASSQHPNVTYAQQQQPPLSPASSTSSTLSSPSKHFPQSRQASSSSHHHPYDHPPSYHLQVPAPPLFANFQPLSHSSLQHNIQQQFPQPPPPSASHQQQQQQQSNLAPPPSYESIAQLAPPRQQPQQQQRNPHPVPPSSGAPFTTLPPIHSHSPPSSDARPLPPILPPVAPPPMAPPAGPPASVIAAPNTKTPALVVPMSASTTSSEATHTAQSASAEGAGTGTGPNAAF